MDQRIRSTIHQVEQNDFEKINEVIHLFKVRHSLPEYNNPLAASRKTFKKLKLRTTKSQWDNDKHYLDFDFKEPKFLLTLRDNFQLRIEFSDYDYSLEIEIAFNKEVSSYEEQSVRLSNKYRVYPIDKYRQEYFVFGNSDRRMDNLINIYDKYNSNIQKWIEENLSVLKEYYLLRQVENLYLNYKEMLDLERQVLSARKKLKTLTKNLPL